jgi:TPR repeat protein
MFKTSLFAVSVLATGLLFTAAASAQTSSSGVTVNGVTPAASEYEPAPETPNPPTSDKDIYCPTAIEPILPGDYYACEARSAYGHDSYRKMVDMLQEAAYWANKDAQYTLGLAYFNGDMPDVPQNRPLGLAWLALAAERKNPSYQLAYASARAKATPQEYQQALKLWRQMRLKYADKVAAQRAILRFNHAIASIDDSARENGMVHLYGYSPYPQSAFSVANKLHEQAATDFEDIHGTVVVGKPEWLHGQQPASASSTSAATQ